MAQTFGPYELLELLGRGGMGEVYRARDTGRHRDVALKVLPPHLASDEVYLARFRRESLLAAQLSDPHIIPIHDFGEIDGRLFIDMRLVSGSDLASVLEDRGPLPLPTAVDIVAQVASALDAAHADGLLHRDVKPSNVMLTGLSADLVRRPPFAYLVDFGIARSSAQMTALTETGAGALGTIAYMSPERISGTVGDGRGDVYALACVLYEALTGTPPFQGELVTLMYQHLNVDPPRPSAERADVPPGLDEVVRTGMAKDPERRYATAGELALAARDALDGTAAPVSPFVAPPAGDVPAAAPPRPRPAPPPARRPRPSTAGDGATRVSGPTWSEPARLEPARSEPARPEPAWSEPARPEPAGSEPAAGVDPPPVTLLAAALDSVTRLVRLAGDRYAAVLAEHRATLDVVWSAHGGTVVQAEPERTVVAFADAAAAVAAATACVRATRDARADGIELASRVGVHTGRPVAIADTYWGPDVDRVVRLAGAAHGGQVLLSGAAAALVEAELEPLGRLPLPGFPTPLPLYHLVVDGAGAAQFPRPRTPDGPRTGLPRPPGAVIGRAGELDAVTRLLSRGRRFVALVGAPGVGTTSVAVEAAHRLSPRFESVGYAALDGLAVEAVPAVLARAVGLPELPGTPVTDRLVDGLRDRRTLLVLDTIDAAAVQTVSTLLAGCAGVHVLATGRTPIEGAETVPVGPLAVPASGAAADDVLAAPAVRLLLEALGGPVPDPADAVAVGELAEVARASGGNPTALRLAGALGNAPGAGELEAVVGRALERLDPDERRVLWLLSGAAAALSPTVVRSAAGDAVRALPRLVAARLVEPVVDGRFVVPPSVRAVTAASTAADTTLAAGLARLAEPIAAYGPALTPPSDGVAGEARAVLAALAATRDSHPEAHARLAAAAGALLADAGHGETARVHLDAAASGAVDPSTAARCESVLAWVRGDPDAALAAAERLQGRDGEFAALAVAAGLGRPDGRTDAVVARARDAVPDLVDRPACERYLDLVRARGLIAAGRPEDAAALAETVVSAERPGGARARAAAVAGDAASAAGRPETALVLYAAALREADPAGPPLEPLTTAEGVAAALLRQGRHDDAAAVLAMCDAVHAELAWPASTRLLEVRRGVRERSGPERLTAARARAATYSAVEALAWVARVAGGGRSAAATGA